MTEKSIPSRERAFSMTLEQLAFSFEAKKASPLTGENDRLELAILYTAVLGSILIGQ